MANNYQDQLYLELEDKINAIIDQLPNFTRGYFKALRTRNASQRTRLQYAYDLRRYCLFLASSEGFKDIDLMSSPASVLDCLEYEDIQEYLETLDTYEDIDKNGNVITCVSSPSSKARKISSLRSFYNFLFKTRQVKFNPATLLDVPKIPDKNIVAMDERDVDRILDVVKDNSKLKGLAKAKHDKTWKRDFAIMMTFFGTGIRVSELVGLNLSDINMYSASFIVRRKGGDEDEVPFGPEVQNALQDYIDTCRDILLAGNTEEPALFISMQHKRMSDRTIDHMIKEYGQKAGINVKVTPHALRRTFATYLYSESQDIYLVAEALHHSSVETTRKHYAKISKERKRDAARIASGLLKKE